MLNKQRSARRLTLVGSAILATLLATSLLLTRECRRRQQFERFRIGGLSWTYVLSFDQLEASTPFVAVVQSKTRGTTNAVVNKPTVADAGAARPNEYISVGLLKTDGTTLELYQENPGPDALAFFSALRVGTRYNFPGGSAIR
jgi:hypothetical protein